jgi:hypothetical protein
MKRLFQLLCMVVDALGFLGQEDPHSIDMCDILPRHGAHQCRLELAMEFATW